MAIVTGDRYLDLLARFVEEHAGALLDGSLVLKLNPVGLHYVQTRLEALQELESLRTGAPVDYLRAYIADLGDHRALEQLSRVLSLCSAVKVVSVLPTPARDPSPVALSPFGRLRSLELRGCDLSTSAARGLLQLRPILERLICHNSAEALRHIFAERTVEIQDALVWSRLTSISCAYNGMLLMDDSLQLLPAVQFLDLSRNRFAKAANLHRCARLKFLDLGFNQLRNISSLGQVKSQLVKLVLRNNALVSVHGIASLSSLEALDLSHNLISNFKEIQSVAAIPSLNVLLLEGNPVSFSPCYREEVFSFFTDPAKVYLDGMKIKQSEIWTVKKFLSKRRKQLAEYGLYAPAENNTESQPRGESIGSEDFQERTSDAGANVSRAKRKTSRLALIQDAQLPLVAEVGEQDDSSGFYVSSNYARDKKLDSLDEGDQVKVEAIQLMHKIEALKEEDSRTWLRELRALLEDDDHQSGQPTFDLQNENKKSMMDSKLKELRKRWNKRHKRRQHRSLEGSLYGQEKRETTDSQLREDQHVRMHIDDSALNEGSEIKSMEESSSFNDTVFQSGLNTPGGTSPKMSIDSQFASEVENSIGPGRRVWDTHGVGNADENMHRGLGYAADEEQTSMDESFGSWRVIDEVAESRGAESVLRSPPHYHEEVLQKRQNLEEELLRLSFDSGCAPSFSDSETSDENSIILTSVSSRSEDSPKGFVDFRMEGLELDALELGKDQPPQFNQVGLDVSGQAKNPDMSSYDCEESSSSGPDNETKRQESLGDQHSGTSGWPHVPKVKAIEASRTGHLNPACSDDILANAGGGAYQAGFTKATFKSRTKRKNRRVRTVPLSEENGRPDIYSRVEDGVNSLSLGPDDASTRLNIAELKPFSLSEETGESKETTGISESEAVPPSCAESNLSGSSKADCVQTDFIGTSLAPSQVSTSDFTMRAEVEKDLGTAFMEAGKVAPFPKHRGVVTNGNLEDPVEEFFRLKIGISEAEFCLQYLKCGCIRLWEDSPVERDIFLLLSSKGKLYMLAESRKKHVSVGGSDVFHVAACHKLQDVKKVTVGLGLQALRVDIGHSASYLFVTRNVNMSREILDMLRRPTEEDSGSVLDFESWEQRQLRMFEELVLGGARTSILMYLMPHFCYGDSSENIWVARSVFLTSHHIFLCVEDLVHFGVASEDLIAPQHPYFIMEASADIYDLSQVVAGSTDGCVTLNFEKIMTGCSFPSDHLSMKAESKAQELSRSLVWKFKGVLEEVASKLVALLRASHMEVALHPLTVKRVFSCELV